MLNVDISKEAVERLAHNLYAHSAIDCPNTVNILVAQGVPTLRAQADRIEDLEAALANLVGLRDNTSPFGGELQADRIERTFEAAAALLTKDTAP